VDAGSAIRSNGRMPLHEDEVETSVDLVRALVRDQFPQWADLPVTRVAEFGTDHALYRLGDDLVARLPIIHWAVDQVASDARWMPVLGPLLPLEVPQPVGFGAPAHGYPYPWLVVGWLPGRTPSVESLDQEGVAEDLAAFVRALHAIDTTGGALKTGTMRGVPLAGCDQVARSAIVEAGDRIDGRALLDAWEDALAADPWPDPPVWIHGDLLAGNLLEVDGRLAAVIDFGALGLGDPAADVAPAWSLLDAVGRERYRNALGYDDHTWRRGRGWAVLTSVTGLAYYEETAPAFTRRGLRTIGQVVDDVRTSRSG
jgi:aminoglycoside phosphotransferase (APT) family kinase protein